MKRMIKLNVLDNDRLNLIDNFTEPNHLILNN